MNPVAWAVALAACGMSLARPRTPGRRLPPTNDEASGANDPTGGRARRPAAFRHLRRSADPTSGCFRGSATLRRRPSRRGSDPIELARWCESLARAVRGGDTLHAALDRVRAPEPVAVRLRARPRCGETATDAPPTPDVALVVAVATACLDHGGPAAEPLDRAAGVLRARAAERAERQIQSAQARLSATVLTCLPVVMLLVLLTTSAAARHVVASPYGVVLVIAGGALNATGWWWMRRTIDRAAR